VDTIVPHKPLKDVSKLPEEAITQDRVIKAREGGIGGHREVIIESQGLGPPKGDALIKRWFPVRLVVEVL
jgi:hypothetical protein